MVSAYRNLHPDSNTLIELFELIGRRQLRNDGS